VAFVPGAAAFSEPGRGRSSMRLNFSGCGVDEIREGIRRIGKVVDEQLALYETITGEHRLPAGRPSSSPGEAPREDSEPDTQELGEAPADILPLRPRRGT
jgi:2-aminoadipate transaminase